MEISFPYRILNSLDELNNGDYYEVKDITTGKWGRSIYYIKTQCRDKINNLKHLIENKMIRVKNK